jgi:hypothetical protein
MISAATEKWYERVGVSLGLGQESWNLGFLAIKYYRLPLTVEMVYA